MAKKHLVIVESPAKAKTIGKYLGKDYEVKASMGHLRDLPKSKLGVDIEHDFEPVYQPIRGKEELISELKKAAKSSETKTATVMAECIAGALKDTLEKYGTAGDKEKGATT